MFILIPVLQAADRFDIMTLSKIEGYKSFFDDPRPLYKDLSMKKIIPPEIYSKYIYDVEAMKKLWAEVVGFRAPDVVGKIAPEIRPGTYNYKDKEKYPGIKELMIPEHYKRFNPGAPPFAGNYPEIKIVPTRQYYWALPIAEATKKNLGRTKQDDQGYIISDSYIAGYPYPKPEGKFKAQQIVYNWVKRYGMGESGWLLGWPKGFTKNLKMDFDGATEMVFLRLNGRVMIEPLGWFDQRARERKEEKVTRVSTLAPRDQFGNAFSQLVYLDPNHVDSFLGYINVLRRVRKLSATDTQDPFGGQDWIYDDNENFSQKLEPKNYPYKYEVIGEREYLVPSPDLDGSGYLTSKGLELRGFEFERRPTYVVQLTQLNPAYVYSKRILYIDKETLMLLFIENYDQKGRLYRDAENIYVFHPEMGLFASSLPMARDHIDLHSTVARHFVIPVASWVNRNDVDISSLGKKK
jgi:hypothetical protein